MLIAILYFGDKSRKVAGVYYVPQDEINENKIRQLDKVFPSLVQWEHRKSL